MILANNIDSLDVKQAEIILDFIRQISGSPYIKVKLDSLLFEKVTFD